MAKLTEEDKRLLGLTDTTPDVSFADKDLTEEDKKLLGLVDTAPTPAAQGLTDADKELLGLTKSPAETPEEPKSFVGKVSRAEIEETAKQFGVSADKLQNLAPLTVGVETSDLDDDKLTGRDIYEKAAKYVPRAGAAAGALGGIPGIAAGFAASLLPGAVKKFGTTDAEEKALEALQEKASARTTTAGKVADIATEVAPAILGGIGAAKTIAAKAGGALRAAGVGERAAKIGGGAVAGTEQALEGAVIGAASAASGQEGTGAAISGLLGAIPAAGETASAISKKAGRAIKIGAPVAGAVGGPALLSDSDDTLLDKAKLAAAGALGGAFIGGTASLFGENARARKEALEAFNNTIDARAAGILRENPDNVFSNLTEKLTDVVANKEKSKFLKDADVREFLQQSLGRSPAAISKNPEKFVEELAARGDEFAGRRIDEYVTTKAIEAAQKEIGAIGPDSGAAEGFLRMVQRQGDVGRFANELDEMYSSKLQPVIQNTSSAMKQFDNTKAQMAVKIAKPVDKLLQNASYSPDELFQAMRKAEGGDLSAITDEMQPAVKLLQEGFAAGKKLAESRGVKIKDRGQYYVPEMLKTGTDLTRSAINHFRDLVGGDLANWRKFGNVDDVLGESDRTLLETLTGKRVESGEDVFSVVRSLGGVKSDMSTEGADTLSAIFARKGEYPEWAKETNPVRLLNKYYDVNVRGAFLQEPLAEMRGQLARIAARSGREGDKEAVAFIENWVRDMSGGQGAAAAAVEDARRKFSTKYGVAADEARAQGNIPKAALLETLSEAPQAMDYLLRQVYVNVLTKPKSLLTNLSSTATVLAPQYGPGWTIKNLPAAMKAAASKGKEIDARFEAQGLSSDFNRPAFRTTIRNELAKSPAFAVPKETLDYVSDKLMAVYSYTETLNKRVMDTLNTKAAEELVSGQTGPKQLLQGMDAGNRRNLNKLLSSDLPEAQKIEAVRDELNKYSQSRFLFNYDKASTSGLIRDLGPLFSTFSRWPVSVASELLQGVRQGRGVEEFSKYGGVWGLLSLADKAFQIDERVEESPRLQYFLGSDGLSSNAPFTSAGNVVGIGNNEMFTPLIVKQAKDAFKAVSKSLDQENAEPLAEGALKLFSTLGPGGYVPRVINEDLPRLRDREPGE